MNLLKKIGMVLAGIGFLSGASGVAAEDIQEVTMNEPIVLTQGMNQEITNKLLIGTDENNNMTKPLYHYSHSSHASHYSHGSHTSHYSSHY